MFLCAVARPKWNTEKHMWFDGKIGIWAFVHKVAAIKNSRNRPKGTLETKNITSVNAVEYQKTMIEKVLPTIKEKWPPSYRSKSIIIQEDNARPHSKAARNAISNAAKTDGWNIELRPQPPNSPDMNVLDLGFFNSIQSLQYAKQPRTMDELILAVETAYQESPRETINKVF